MVGVPTSSRLMIGKQGRGQRVLTSLHGGQRQNKNNIKMRDAGHPGETGDLECECMRRREGHEGSERGTKYHRGLGSIKGGSGKGFSQESDTNATLLYTVATYR